MKRTILAAALAATAALTAGALDLESSGSFGNLGFDTSAAVPLGASGFSGNYDWGTTLSATERIGDAFTFSAGFERRPITRNIVFTKVGFDAGFARLSVGPFFGPFNAEGSVLTSGLSTSLSLELPGLLFGSFRSDSTIGAGLAAPGDYVQERSEVSVGFWVPNVVLAATLSSDSFTYRSDAVSTEVDRTTRYAFSADVYKKNVPYTLRLTAAYESLSRSYLDSGAGTELVDELGLALAGLETSIRINDGLKIKVGAEAALYAWGIGDLASPPTDLFLYRAWAGATLSIPTKGIQLPAKSDGDDAGLPAL